MKIYQKYFILLTILSVFSCGLFAKSLPVGITLNMSGTDAQYSLDFKNGIEAYFQAANSTERFGKYKLQLISMDDMGNKERAISNTKRLVKNKQSLALISTHEEALLKEISNISLKTNTLLLSSINSKIDTNKKNKNFLAYLNAPIIDQLAALKTTINVAESIFILTNQNNDEILSTVNSYIVDPNSQKANNISSEQLLSLSSESASTFIINKNFIEATQDIKTILSFSEKHTIYVMSSSGPSLIANALKYDITSEKLQQVNYLNTVPLHQLSLKAVKEFRDNMNNFNPNASKSHQAFKGYLLADVLASAIEQSMEGIKTDSLLGVITLPFQILDKVVGWVKHAGADINRKIIAQELRSFKSFDLGLNEKVNLKKSNVIINKVWFTQANKNGLFIENQL